MRLLFCSAARTDRSAHTLRRFLDEAGLWARGRYMLNLGNSCPAGLNQDWGDEGTQHMTYLGLDAPKTTEFFIASLLPLGYETTKMGSFKHRAKRGTQGTHFASAYPSFKSQS